MFVDYLRERERERERDCGRRRFWRTHPNHVVFSTGPGETVRKKNVWAGEHEANALSIRSFFVPCAPTFSFRLIRLFYLSGKVLERVVRVGNALSPPLFLHTPPPPLLLLRPRRPLTLSNVVFRFAQWVSRRRLAQSRCFNFVRRSGAERVSEEDCGAEVRRYPFWNRTPHLSLPPFVERGSHARSLV